MRPAAILFLVPMVLGGAPAAHAAAALNGDTVTHTLNVSEADRRYSVTLRPGESASFCERGCFVEFPNGERRALTGFEFIEIGPDGVPRVL